MKISYNWLNGYFDNTLPPPEDVVHELTFHAWEVEDVEKAGEDTVLEVKVLPDRTHHALSHRGIAKDLSVILNMPLSRDPLQSRFMEHHQAFSLSVDVQSSRCTRYQAAVIRGVKVGPSPGWLEERLTAIGQRSINNVVDATNYIMFELGQPLHAFDAQKLTGYGNAQRITVRNAREGERITTLTGEECMLTPDELLIVDGGNDVPIGIAGIKGGKQAEVDMNTAVIILESANFNSISIRKSSQRLRLRTDASMRFENGIVPSLTEPALKQVVDLILQIAGGTLIGISETRFETPAPVPVSVSLQRLERVLGVAISPDTIHDIMRRFGYTYTLNGDVLVVTPPLERIDLNIPEDLIEEIGRIYGYDHIPSVVPSPFKDLEINKRFYYSEAIRSALIGVGFSEVYTSSFRSKDIVRLKNAIATDKEYLRSSLCENLREVLVRNVPNRDLLGIPSVSVFEIGTVFTTTGESYMLAIGVRHGVEYKEKTDNRRLNDACTAVETALGTKLPWNSREGIAETDLGALLDSLPEPTQYATFVPTPIPTFVPYSNYPAMSRDIAFWTSGDVTTGELAELIRAHAGPLLARLTLFDEFSKEGRTSYAFRLVFQSSDRTLTDAEVIPFMEAVMKALISKNFEVR